MDKSQRDEIKNLISFGDEDKENTMQSDNVPNIPEAEDFDGGTETDIPETEDFDGGTETDIPETEDFNGGTETDIPETEDFDIGADADIPEDSASDVTDEEEAAEDDSEEGEPGGAHLTGADIEYGYGFDGAYTEEEKKPSPKVSALVKGCVIAAAVIAAAVIFTVTDTGIIGAYKRNFRHNFHKIFNIPETPVTELVPEDINEPENNPETDTAQDAGIEADTTENEENTAESRAEFVNMDVKSSVIIPYEFASESDYGVWAGGVVCASTNYMCFINGNGEIEWECATSVIDPILDTAGRYILIAQEGGTKLCLYEGNKLLYDTDCEDNILAADLSENGDCVLVTTKDLYKGAIAAYNKSGQLIFARSSGGGSIIDAAVSPSSRNIAAALLDTDNSVKSTVEIFDITKDDPIASAELDDVILFDLEYFGNTVSAFGDNAIAGIKSDGEIIYDKRFDGEELIHYAYDSEGGKLLMLNASNIPTLAVYNGRGKEKSVFSALDTADFLCIDGNRIMYNNDREIIAGKANGGVFERYTASMDIRELIMVDKDMFFIVYSNSLELIKK